jgi:hypothetical protein
MNLNASYVNQIGVLGSVSQQVCGRHGPNFILGFVLSHTGYIAGDLLERSAIIYEYNQSHA